MTDQQDPGSGYAAEQGHNVHLIEPAEGAREPGEDADDDRPPRPHEPAEGARPPAPRSR
jgi:hypothetical protein